MPLPSASNLDDPHASWLQIILGDVQKASAESRKNVKEKAEQQIFQAVVRIGQQEKMHFPLAVILSAFLGFGVSRRKDT